MTGPEHYKAAEDCVDRASSGNFEYGDPRETFYFRAAQVHATLALAAATALNDHTSDGGLPLPDWNAWMAAAGTPKDGDDG